MITLGKKVFLGTIWSAVGQFAYMAVSLITNIILARLISPDDFGKVSIIMFFVTLGLVFSESGLGGALVRKKSLSKLDCSTVFVFNLVLGVICFLIICASAPFISSYYEDANLSQYLIVASVILIINAFNIIQNSLLIRDMKFKSRAVYKTISITVASLLSIVLALKGFGIWALVYLQIFNVLFYTSLLWLQTGSYVSLGFSRASFRETFSFGVNTTLASLIQTFFDNIYQVVFAKHFTYADAGLFYQAKRLQDVPNNVIQMTAVNVVFSGLSKLQDDIVKLKQTYRKIIGLFTVLMGLISSLIFIYSDDIVKLLYGERWDGTDYYIKMLCIASFFYMQEQFNRVIFKVFDQTQKILMLELVKKAIQAITIFGGIYYRDISVLLWGYVITAVLSYILNFIVSRKVMGDVNYYEFIILLKVVGVSVMLSYTSVKIYSYCDIAGPLSFLGVPIFTIAYFSAMHVLRIADVKREFSQLIQRFR